MAKPVTPPPATLVLTSARLFSDDVTALKQLAETKRTKWQTELRHLVHRALTDQKKLGAIIR